MSRCCLLIMVLSISTVLKAQVILSNPINSSANNLSELLAINIQNTSLSSVSGIINFKVYQSSNLVLSGNTKSITVASKSSVSINQVNASQLLKPFSFGFYAPSMQVVLNANNPVPNGNYEVCVQFISNGTPVSNEACGLNVLGQITTNGTLFLISPIDEATSVTDNPIFSWVNVGNNILYEFTLAEMHPGQSKYIAINNAPYYLKNDLTNNSLIYPIFARELEECKTYAWQVKSYNQYTIPNGESGRLTATQTIATSEVFSFKTECDEIEEETSENITYMGLFKNYATHTHVIHELIPFKYTDKYNSNAVDVKIYNINGDTSIYHNEHFELKRPNGDNYLIVEKKDLHIVNESKDECYYLEVMNVRGEKWRTKFKFEE